MQRYGNRVTTRRILLASLVTLGLAATGCGAGPDTASGAAPGPVLPPMPGAASNGAAPNGAASCAQQRFAKLTLPQRVGQLFLAGIDVNGPPDTAAIKAGHLGSVLFVGNSTAGVTAVRRSTAAIQALATSQDTGGVRFFVAANQEGGQIQPLRGPGFSAIPPATVQGTMSPARLQAQAEQWGRELKKAGVNLDLAPVLDVVPPGTAAVNAPIGQLQREYGDTPATVATHGAAFIKGMAEAGVATTIKHFPGLGRVRGNTDFTADAAAITDTVTTKTDPYLESYQAGIDAGAPLVMVALARYTRIDAGHLAAFSTTVIDGMLRHDLHFTGVVVSDDLGAAAAVADVPAAARAIDFLNAGGDLVTSQSASVAATMAAAVLRQAQDSATFRERITTSVMRILTAKAEYGLLSC